MQKMTRCALFAALYFAASGGSALAGDLKLTIANGRVTLIADDVPVRQILAEWARVGQTTIVNADKVIGPSVTLQLVDVPEGVALDAVLRSTSGYVAAPRSGGRTGVSVYDRIMILAASRAPATMPPGPAAPPTPFTRVTSPPMPQPDSPADDDGDSKEPGAAPGAVQAPGMQPGPGMPTNTTSPPQTTPGFAPAPAGQPQPVLTAPRPGMLPAPPPQTPNPYQPFTPQPPAKKPVGGGPGGN